MDINEKNIAAAFGNLDPTEEQKERIYENILKAENDNVKKITSGRFRRKRAGSVIAAAAAVLTMGTLSFSALGLIGSPLQLRLSRRHKRHRKDNRKRHSDRA